MSALEDIELEGIRDVLGALFLFSRGANSEVSFNSLNEAGALNGMTYLKDKGYLSVVDSRVQDNPVYQLNDDGWEYLTRVLNLVREEVSYPQR